MTCIVAKIHQGRFDSEIALVNLRCNALAKSRIDVIDAVDQRLRKSYPKIYERLVGPLYIRNRDAVFKCYCNYPSSLESICNDILSGKVHHHALICDACWQEDIAKTWGYYGWSKKKISRKTWEKLCDNRAYYKYSG